MATFLMVLFFGYNARVTAPVTLKKSKPISYRHFLADDINQILILWSRNTPQSERLARSKQFGDVVYTGKYAPITVVKISGSIETTIDAIRGVPGIRAVAPNFKRKLLWTPNDPYFNQQWNFQENYIGMPSAWDYIPTGGDTTVKVGILDSGIAFEDFAIPDYELNEVYSQDSMYHIAPDMTLTHFAGGYDAVHQDYHPNDQVGHGTHVAGTVAQSTNNLYGVAGIAFGVTLVPIQIADYQGTIYDNWVVDGLYYADSVGVDIVNMSFGGPQPSDVIHAAIQDLYSHGIIMVAATGNDGDSSIYYPAAYDEVIAVGASNVQDIRSNYSNYGVGIDLVAPGGDALGGILQETYAGLYQGLTRVDTFALVYKFGTSMAAPHVSGALALLLSLGADPTEAVNLIKATAKDIGEPGYDQETGFGRLDVKNAIMTYIEGTLPPYDTLRNNWQQPFYIFVGNDQIAYEATRYLPQQPCSLQTVRVLFWNYDSLQTHSKSCTLFVWQDQNGIPGDPLVSVPVEVSLPPDSMDWIEIDLSQYGLYQDSYFWIGHFESDTGPPTSIADATPSGTNMFKYPSGTWNLDTDYDYLQEVVVKYFAYEDSVPPAFDVWMLRNPYLDRLVDFWVVSSEILKNAAPPESTLLLLPDSTTYDIAFRTVDRQTFKADYTLSDTGMYVLMVKGRDYKDNWGDTTFVFNVSQVGINGGIVHSPDRVLQITIPEGAFNDVVTITTYKTQTDSIIYNIEPNGKPSVMPINYFIKTTEMLNPYYRFNNSWKKVDNVTYTSRGIGFRLNGIYSLMFKRKISKPVLLVPFRVLRSGDLVRMYLPMEWYGTRVYIYSSSGRRQSIITPNPTQKGGIFEFIMPDAPSGVYFLIAKTTNHRNFLGKVILLR